MHLGTSAKQWEEFSDSERFQHIEALRGHFVHYIEYWSNQGLLGGQCFVDAGIYSDVIRHYYRDLGRLGGNMQGNGSTDPFPNDFKQKAVYAFWIRKLKPITITGAIEGFDGDSTLWINEIIAIFIAMTELDIIYAKTVSLDLPEEIMHDLLYFFRYKSVSPHSLYLTFASMYSV